MTVEHAIAGSRLWFMPLMIDDFLASNLVAELDEVWRWRYVKLLMRAWMMPCPCFLPNDEIAILRLMGAPETDRMSQELHTILKKFPATGDGLHRYNPKQFEVYQRAEKEQTGKARKGRLGADARWSGHARALPEDCPSNGIQTQTHIQTPETTDIDSHRLSKKEVEGAFEKFWEAYPPCGDPPKRRDRAAAFKAFEKAAHKTATDSLIAAAGAYARERQGQESRFTKHAATWLNQGSWSDQAAPGFTGGDIARAGQCTKHPRSGSTPSGSCWGCVEERKDKHDQELLARSSR